RAARPLRWANARAGASPDKGVRFSRKLRKLACISAPPLENTFVPHQYCPGRPKSLHGCWRPTALFDTRRLVPDAASELQRSPSHHQSRSAGREAAPASARPAEGNFLLFSLFRSVPREAGPWSDKRRSIPLNTESRP